MENKTYYDDDANIDLLKDKVVGIIGYGIQGRNQALNLRDSGVNVLVANRQDDYVSQLTEDDFSLTNLEDIAGKSDIIFMLIPDQAQKGIYEKYIKDNLKDGGLLVFAHGYALHFKEVLPKSVHNAGMLAPRMPGKQIRGFYKEGRGVPAFMDVFKDESGDVKDILLALSKAIGFTRAGVMEVSCGVEAELDLFIEQYLIPIIVKTVSTSFEELVNTHNYPKVAALSELYASGEVAEVLGMAAKVGIGRVFQENASPTCQFGIADGYDKVLLGDQRKVIADVVTNIKNGNFAKKLQAEGENGYPEVKKLWSKVNSDMLTDTQNKINKIFKV